jgi:hypothetical protein
MYVVAESAAGKESGFTGGYNGYTRVLAFIEEWRPSQDEERRQQEAQQKLVASTPTLLPNLKFHELVFGHVIGSGSFSDVK